MAQEKRPDIKTLTSGVGLKRWYWLKAELLAEARRLGLKTTGQKFAILDRIAHFHDTGSKVAPKDVAPKTSSKFDWHCAELTPDTTLTDSYKNTQNVRRFFKSQVGDTFKFNIEFMAWMKNNTGATLADAVAEYMAMKLREADPEYESVIAHHNQFNQYTRDFLGDNPKMGMSDVRHFWALKRALPSDDGRHVYERSDLDLT